MIFCQNSSFYMTIFHNYLFVTMSTYLWLGIYLTNMITRCINDVLYLQKVSRVVYSQTDPYLKQLYERSNQQRETCSSDRTVKSFFIINYINFLNIYAHQFKNAEHIKTLLVHIYVCIVYQKLFLSKLAII